MGTVFPVYIADKHSELAYPLDLYYLANAKWFLKVQYIFFYHQEFKTAIDVNGYYKLKTNIISSPYNLIYPKAEHSKSGQIYPEPVIFISQLNLKSEPIGPETHELGPLMIKINSPKLYINNAESEIRFSFEPMSAEYASFPKNMQMGILFTLSKE